MGTEGWREDDICGHAFVEDVFVPFPKGESILVAMEVEEDRDVDVCGERAGDVEVSVPVSGDKNVNKDVKTEVETMFRDGVWDTGVPVLEFWPVDDRGGVVRVYSEEPLGRDAYRDLKEREDDADDVNRTCAQDRDGSGYVWSWFPCVQRRQIRMRWW
jgi:hypothetical protein